MGRQVASEDDLDDIVAEEFVLWAAEMHGHDFELFRQSLWRKYPELYRQPPPAPPTVALPGPRKVKCMADRRAAGFSCFAPGDISHADEAIERLARVVSTHPNSAVVYRDNVDQTYNEEAAITEEELEDEQEFEAYLQDRRRFLQRCPEPGQDKNQAA